MAEQLRGIDMEPSKQRDGVAPGSAATPKLNIRCECRDDSVPVIENAKRGIAAAIRALGRET